MNRLAILLIFLLGFILGGMLIYKVEINTINQSLNSLSYCYENYSESKLQHFLEIGNSTCKSVPCPCEDLENGYKTCNSCYIIDCGKGEFA